MVIDGKEYTKILKVTDIKLALHLGRFDECKYLDRLIEIKNENGKFDYMTFWVNYNSQDELVCLLYNYAFKKFFEENQEKLLTKFVTKEWETFCSMNEEGFLMKYFNDDNLIDNYLTENKKTKDLEEIKGEI